MVLPLIAAGISAAGSIAAAKMSSQKDPYAQAAAAEQANLARKQAKLATAGSTNARGSKQLYDPTTNQFITDLSPIERALMQASDTEQLNQLTNDAALYRDQLQANADLAGRERDVAGQYFQRLANPKDNVASIEGAMIRNATRGSQDAINKAVGAYSRQALRSGVPNSNNAEMFSRLATDIGNNQAAALDQAQLGALTTGTNLNAAQMNANQGIYGALTGRNIGQGQMPFSNIASSLDQAQQGARGTGAYNLMGAGQSFARSGIVPNDANQWQGKAIGIGSNFLKEALQYRSDNQSTAAPTRHMGNSDFAAGGSFYNVPKGVNYSGGL